MNNVIRLPLTGTDDGVPGAIRAMSAAEAVSYCKQRGWWIWRSSEDETKFNYGINHRDVNDISSALGEKKPEILGLLSYSVPDW